MLRVLCVCLFASFVLGFNSFKSEVVQSDDQFAYVADDERLKIGHLGVVVQNFKDSRMIVARVKVVEKGGELAKLEITPFEMLTQEALPSVATQVKAGDEVWLDYLYNRAMLIAPSEDIYRQVVRAHAQMYFLHPDILGAYMIKEFKLSPKKEDFQQICDENALGVLAFALRKELVFVNCLDFTLLGKEALEGEILSPQTPFYSRIDGYQKNFFNFFEWRVKDYYEYYSKLIGQENAK